MGQVLVRNLEDRVISTLKLKAELHGHSLEQELREILTHAAGLSPQEKVALSDRIRAMTPPQPEGVVFPTAEELIREDRDSR